MTSFLRKLYKNMKKLYLSLAILLLCMFVHSCEMFEAHPYDTHVKGEKNLNERFARQITEKLTGKKTFRFAFISDTQRWYDETEDVVNIINQRNDIDFVIHGGDLSDFGVTHEFEMQRDIMLGFDVPWVTLIGNHDCLGTGEDTYQAIWGNPNFYFKAGNTLFVCLNTNCMEFNYTESVPDFTFLENLQSNLPDGIERTIVAMHVPPFDLEFNNNIANIFQEQLKKFPNLLFCINGHCHRFAETDLFKDGVLYHQTTCIGKRGYMIFTMTEDGYEYENIEF